jgi:hypothetical protein
MAFDPPLSLKSLTGMYEVVELATEEAIWR